MSGRHALVDESVVAALTAGLIDDSGMDLAAHHGHRNAWFATAVGPLHWPASQAESLWDSLTPGADPVDVVLVSDAGAEVLRLAREALLDEDRIEVVGLQVPLVVSDDPGRETRRLLDDLSSSVPAAILIPPAPGWQGALDALAEDGAERAAWSSECDERTLAMFVRSCLDRGLAFSLVGGSTSAVRSDESHGLLNVMAAVAVGLGGADADHLGAVLGERSATPLLGLLADPPARSIRRHLISVSSPLVEDLADDLREHGVRIPQ